MGIYAALAETDQAAVLREHGGKGFGAFKEALAALVVDKLTPIARRDASGCWPIRRGSTRCCAMGAERAAAIADPIVAEAERLVGFLKV